MTGANDTPATGDTPAEDPNAHVKPGLSDEEKAALAAEDDADVTAGAATGDDGKPAVPSPQAAGDTPADGDGAGTPAVDTPTPPPEIPRGRASNTELMTSHDIDPKATQERLISIDTEITALDAKLESGDIEAKDYAIQSRTLSGEQGDLKADLREVGFVYNANTQLASGDWNRSVDQFMQENAQFDEPIMSGALNAALNTLYTDEKNVGASHNWYLQTAARAVSERISPAQAALDAPPGTDGTPVDKNAQAVADAAAAAKKAAAAKDGLPVTLGDTPAAGAADVSAGEFAALDNLKGMELESKLASMTTAQQDAYLRG